MKERNANARSKLIFIVYLLNKKSPENRDFIIIKT